MFYLISGRILSGIVFVIIFKLFNSYSDLILVEKIVGWFFIDHIFEEYGFTSGKFFLINKDYRDLIKNLAVLCGFLWFFAQQFVLLELFIICIFLVFVVVVLKWKINKNLFIGVSYIYLLSMFLIVNFYLIKFSIFICGLIMCIILYCEFFILLFIRDCSLSSIKRLIIILNLKLIMFLSVFFLCFVFFFCTNINNFVVERVLQLLILYTYMYCF